MFNQNGERTLIPSIIPPMVAHVHAVYEINLQNEVETNECNDSKIVYQNRYVDKFVDKVPVWVYGLIIVLRHIKKVSNETFFLLD